MMKGWSPFGFIPDILSGKSPTQALEDGVKTAGTLAAIYSTGGAAAPAAGGSGLTLGGSSAASGMGGGSGLLAGAPSSVAGMGGSGVSAPASALSLSAPSSGGSFMASMQPYMQAANAASQVKGLLGDGGQPIPAPQVQQGNPAGAQTLAQLYQQGTQLSPQDQARLQRKSMWG